MVWIGDAEDGSVQLPKHVVLKDGAASVVDEDQGDGGGAGVGRRGNLDEGCERRHPFPTLSSGWRGNVLGFGAGRDWQEGSVRSQGVQSSAAARKCLVGHPMQLFPSLATQ